MVGWINGSNTKGKQILFLVVVTNILECGIEANSIQLNQKSHRKESSVPDGFFPIGVYYTIDDIHVTVWDTEEFDNHSFVYKVELK